MLRLARASVTALSLAIIALGHAQASNPAASPAIPTVTTITVSSGRSPVTSVIPKTVVTLTATVVSGKPPAQLTLGQIKFCDADAAFCTDIHILATAQLTSAGTATYKFVPGTGTHHYKAIFLGTQLEGVSTSSTASLSVAPLTNGATPSATTITSSGGPGDYTLTATVSGNTITTPTGTVSFLDTTNNNYVLGTAALSIGASGLGLQESSISPTNLNPASIVTADFNGDGILDIATANQDSTGAFVPGSLTILLGKGDGTFNIASSVPTGIGPAALVTSDFNNDGIADLAFTTTISGNVSIFLGNGDGTFTAAPDPIELSFGQFYGIASGDFNHDGNQDLAITNIQTQSILILLGNGDGTFNTVLQQPATGNNPVNIVVGDFNQDGNLDLAVDNLLPALGSSVNSLTILLGNGRGGFDTGTSAIVGTRPQGLVAADLNGDGVPDLAVIDILAQTIEVLLSNGDGTFSLPIVTGGLDQLHSIAVGDFNGDGKPDLVAFLAGSPPPPFPAENIVTLLGNGDGHFTSGAAVLDANNPNFGAVADFNGDGVPDIASESQSSTGFVTIYLTTFSGEPTATVTHISPVGIGTHFVDAQYSGDSVYASSLSTTIPLTAEPVATALQLAAAPAGGSNFGDSVTLTASLAPNVAQDHDATGTVTFLSNGIMIGTGAIAFGVATFTTTALVAGADKLTATYPGDTNFQASTSATLAYTVISTASKTQTITFPPPASPVPIGSPPVTLVATASSGLPVTFKLISGPAVLTGSVLSFIGAGTVVVAADQPGDATYAAAPEVTHTVIVTPPVSVSLSVAPALAFLLNPVTLTAAISVTGAPAAGMVSFIEGTQSIGSSAPQGGAATISLSNLSLGPHTIVAKWSGDAARAAQSSATVVVIIEDFSVAFTDPQITINHGGTATLTLQLAPVGGPSMASQIDIALGGQPTGSQVTMSAVSIAAGAGSTNVTVAIATPNYPTGPYAYLNGGYPHDSRHNGGNTGGRIFFAVIAFGGFLLPFARRTRHLRSSSPWNSALLTVVSAALILGAIGCGSGWNTEVFQIQVTATSGALSHTATATLTSKCSNGQPSCPVSGE